VADIASVSYEVQTHSLKGIQVAQALGFEYPLSFAYRKDLPAVGAQLESALQRLDLLELKKITNQWIDVDALHYEDPNRSMLRWVSIGVAALAAVLLVLAYLRRRAQGAQS